ncbi:MAG: flagellar assembly protein FliW [Campylobacterota bacterium]|nr:flagellar assembly protein FliW [Campylobacterota bacterium]
MNYDVVLPISGFEDIESFSYEKVDNFFSIITCEESNISLKLMSFNALSNISFELDETYAKALDIQDQSDIRIYYVFVIQNPIKNSVLNMYAPLIFNQRSKKMGQIQLDLAELGLETIEAMIPGI